MDRAQEPNLFAVMAMAGAGHHANPLFQGFWITLHTHIPYISISDVFCMNVRIVKGNVVDISSQKNLSLKITIR
jgi:hypothetical protein